MFRKYEKVQRMEKSECDGILNGRCYVYEKIDGANASCWLNSDGQLCCGSRNRQLSCGEEVEDPFKGFVSWVNRNQPIKDFLADYPNFRLYGEWLVKHTLNYPQEAYGQLYVFDVYDDPAEAYLHYIEYEPLLEEYGVLYLKPLKVLHNPSMGDIKELVGQTLFDIPHGEGVVVKNYGFVNRFGYRPYAKLVTKEFREVNALVFPASKEWPVEVRIASRYATEARVAKNIHKIAEQIGRDVQIEDTKRVLSTVYYDIITEDMWGIIKEFRNPIINFSELRRQIQSATRNHFFAYLHGERTEEVAS